MKLPSIRKTLSLSGTILALALFGSSTLFAQYSQTPAPAQQPADKPATATTPPAPKVDPAEEADYKAFFELKPDDTEQHITLGTAFVQKYPDSKYAEAVYSQMTTAEYKKQNYDKMYADADKAIALNPDDVTVLVVTGWVIPHTYNADDPQADAKLAKAAKYEKHALEVLPTLAKPAAMANMTDDQFTKDKAELESQAHSGLGLVYFRQQNYDGAVTELSKGVATTANPDPTDYFVLGFSLAKLDKFSDAADAYTKCAAIPGGLQARCKQQADDAKKQAASKPAPPK
jgi:tetratricopeptide (TPR) repeat protein